MQAMSRKANYWYMLPTSVQARRAIWNAVNPHSGERRIYEAFIGPYNPTKGQFGLIEREVDDEMILHLVNGSTVQLVGSDNFNSLLGSPPAGLIFSEWAICDPMSWALLRPIVRENGGFAIFVTTPRGENHAALMYREAVSDPNWFAMLSPATETTVFSPEDLETEKRELMREFGEDQGLSLFNQEMMCSFSAGLVGSYFGHEMERAELGDLIEQPDGSKERQSRITSVPYDPRLPCHTSWDLGMSDDTCIVIWQIVGKEFRAIDFISNSGQGLNWYVRELQTRPYTYGQHILPHDAQVRELGTGRSRVETLRSLGIVARVIPAQSIPDGINAVRTILGSCWFDKVKCKRLIESLRQHRRTWDDKRKAYADRPYHDWTSHAVDAVKYFALANVRNAQKRDIKYPNMGIV